jgi:nucleoside-triphosphatase
MIRGFILGCMLGLIMGFSEEARCDNTKEPIKKHILLTGPPSVGKSTIIRKIIERFSFAANGFYTEEERIDGNRVGFITHTLDGKIGYLAHKSMPSEHRLGSYGVSIENIEKLFIPAIAPRDNPVIFIDEIGLLQCFSDQFIASVKNALDSDSIVIGTIPLQNTKEILEIKERPDVDIIEVTRENRDFLPAILLEAVLYRT